jgi:hypothetical protein
MSIYFCAECDFIKDNDDDPCMEFPEGSNRMVCPDCMGEIENEEELLLRRENE